MKFKFTNILKYLKCKEGDRHANTQREREREKLNSEKIQIKKSKKTPRTMPTQRELKSQRAIGTP